MEHKLERREVVRSFGQKSCRKKTTGNTLLRWKYNSEMYFKEIVWGKVESIFRSEEVSVKHFGRTEHSGP